MCIRHEIGDVCSTIHTVGQNQVVVAGGMESMSNIPYYLPKVRWGLKYGGAELVDGLQKDGLTDAYNHQAMGTCADATATKFNISREDQDRYAIQSYTRAAEATKAGKFKDEICGVSIPQRRRRHRNGRRRRV